MTGAPSAALLLEAWETASAQHPVRRPLTVLSLVTGRDRKELASLTIGERDGLILRLRASLFGQQIVALATCPACGTDAELLFLVRELLLDAPVLREVFVQIGGRSVIARPLTAGDLEEAALSGDVRQELLRRCVPEDVTGIDEASSELGAALAQADPLSQIELELSCPSCNVSGSRLFDPWAFLWEELRAWSVRTLGQVHRLAQAYGWSEVEILALSPQRRNTYLRLVGA